MKKILSIIRNLIFFPIKISNLVKLKLNHVKSGKQLNIRGSLFILNEGVCNIDDHVIINSSKYKNIIGGDTRTSIIIKEKANLDIGKRVKISNTAIYCAEKITIGNDVMIGGSCRIWDTDFHPLNHKERAKNPNEQFNTKPINIGDNVFIGGFSIILKGTSIGNGAILGAGSVVSGIIPEGEIWAGNPAKYIRKI